MIMEEIFHCLWKTDLAEQWEVDEDGVPEGDGPSLQGAVAGRHRHHHRVDRHQDLDERKVIGGFWMDAQFLRWNYLGQAFLILSCRLPTGRLSGQHCAMVWFEKRHMCMWFRLLRCKVKTWTLQNEGSHWWPDPKDRLWIPEKNLYIGLLWLQPEI